jgi:hypothetical protein
MHRLATGYYWLILALFSVAWHQGYAVSSLLTPQEHGQRVPGQSYRYHK